MGVSFTLQPHDLVQNPRKYYYGVVLFCLAKRSSPYVTDSVHLSPMLHNLHTITDNGWVRCSCELWGKLRGTAIFGVSLATVKPVFSLVMIKAQVKMQFWAEFFMEMHVANELDNLSLYLQFQSFEAIQVFKYEILYYRNTLLAHMEKSHKIIVVYGLMFPSVCPKTSHWTFPDELRKIRELSHSFRIWRHEKAAAVDV